MVIIEYIFRLKKLAQRRIQKIQEPLHYLFGFASTFPFTPDRYELVDALGIIVVLPNPALDGGFQIDDDLKDISLEMMSDRRDQRTDVDSKTGRFQDTQKPRRLFVPDYRLADA